jgi:nucleoside-diphosphate-sugar epimerase
MTTQELHVVFGTGPLGSAVAQELHVRGLRVRAINRSGKADLPAGIEVVASDAYDPAQVRAVTSGATVVYQCAQPGYTEWQEKFPPLQRAILKGTAANGAKLIVGENLYMYGEVNGLIHEDLPYLAKTRKGRVRAAMAQEILDWHRTGEIRAAIGRASDFYGPGVLGSAVGDLVFPALLQGKAAQVAGNVDLPHTYHYIHDFGKALVMLGSHDAALGDIWHVPAAPTISTRELIQIAANQLGIQPKITAMNKWMMRLGGLFIPEARETVEMMYEFEKPFVVDHSKFARTFGDFATPHEEAIRQTLAWYQKHLPEKAH